MASTAGWGPTRCVGLLLFLVLIASACLIPALAADTEPAFEHLGVDHGLSNGIVTAILQDQKGFLWIGTEDGLNRYDGLTFKRYRHNPSDPASLLSSNILSLYQDAEGLIWIGGEAGLNYFDPYLDQFFLPFPTQALDEDEDDEAETADEEEEDEDEEEDEAQSQAGDQSDTALLNLPVQVIYRDPDGLYWAGAEGGLFQFKRVGNQFEPVPISDTLKAQFGHTNLKVVKPASAGWLWLGGESGLYRYHPAQDRLITFESGHPLADCDVNVLIPGAQSGWWVGTENLGLIDLNGDDVRIFQHQPNYSGSLVHNQVNALHRDGDGRLWVGTLNGLSILEPQSRRFHSLRNDPLKPGSLSYNEISMITADRSGIMWIGTDGAGLNKFNVRARTFQHMRNDPREPGSLSHNRVQAVLRDSNDVLWVGTEAGGLNRLAPDANQFEHFRHDPDNPNSLSINEVTALTEFQDRLWIGTDEGGLNTLDPATRRFNHYAHQKTDPTTISGNFITDLHVTQQGALWLTTETGLDRYQPQSDDFQRFGNQRGLPEEGYFTVVSDADHRLWVGTEAGLFTLDLDGVGHIASVQAHTNQPQDPLSLGGIIVWAVYASPSGAVWCGTENGLDRLDPKSGLFHHYRERDGLPHDAVYKIQPDTQGRLWLSTGAGLARLDPVTHAVQTYGNRELHNVTFYGGALYRDTEGYLYLGGMNGYNRFKPERVRDNPHPPPVVFTAFRCFNEDIQANQVFDGRVFFHKAISVNPNLSLNHRDNVISFHFAALDFTVPENNQYAYKLEGFDSDWNHIGNRNSATYTNIPPGAYTLRVKAANNSGVWNEAGAALSVTKTPAPWLTWWAKTIYALLVLSAFLGYLRYRTRHHAREMARKNHELAQERRVSEELRRANKLQKERDLAEAAARSKAVFLANMSHEIRTPMNAVLGFLELTLESAELNQVDRKHLTIANNSAKFLLHLINDILDVSKIESGKLELESQPFNLAEVLSETRDMMSVKALQKGLDLRYLMPEDLHPWYRGDAHRLRQILFNLIGNAVKFTESGHIQVRVTAGDQPGHLEFAVEDTGIGIEPQNISRILEPFSQADTSITRRFGGTGLGTTIARELAELMGGRLWITSSPGEGSTFYFTVVLVPCDPGDRRFQGAQPARPQRCFHILLVDDIQENIILATTRLEREGHTVRTGHNGLEAVQAFEKEHFDVILMDVQMPQLDGLGATRRIRELERAGGRDPAVPIIAMTASVMKEDLYQCTEAGMTRAVGKPVDFEALFQIMEDVIPIGWGRLGPVPSATSSVTGVADPKIQGLDWRAGLEAWGDALVYHQALIRFAAEHGRAAHHLRQTLAPNSNDEWRGFLHQLKGLAGNLHLITIRRVCEQLEKEADLTADHALIRDLEQALAAVVTGLGDHLAQPIAKVHAQSETGAAGKLTAVDRAKVARVFNDLLEALDQFDPDRCEAHVTALAPWREALDLQSLQNALDAFDFDRARQAVHNLAQALDLKLEESHE